MTQNAFPEPILNQPIFGLQASDEFKEITKTYGYQTLADMLRGDDPYSLLKHSGFGYRMLTEFVNILEKNDLGHYLN